MGLLSKERLRYDEIVDALESENKKIKSKMTRVQSDYEELSNKMDKYLSDIKSTVLKLNNKITEENEYIQEFKKTYDTKLSEMKQMYETKHKLCESSSRKLV